MLGVASAGATQTWGPTPVDGESADSWSASAWLLGARARRGLRLGRGKKVGVRLFWALRRAGLLRHADVAAAFRELADVAHTATASTRRAARSTW